MSNIPLAGGDRKRSYGKLPHIGLRNIFVEADPSNSVDGLVRLQRPGLTPWVMVGDGPIEYVWRQEGTFNGDQLISSGGILYRVTSAGVSTTLGLIGSGIPQIAARQNDAIIVNNGVRYLTDGSSLSIVSSPIGEAAQSVAAINSYYIIPRANGQIWDWIEPGSTTIDALNFASAERTPDNIESVVIRGDEIWFLGTDGEEVWQPNNDINAPFLRVSSRVYGKGCSNRATVQVIETTLLWVSRDRQVIGCDGQPQAISDNSIAERLRLSDPLTMRAWNFTLDQHPFYVLTTDQGTFSYDLSTKIWSHFSSYDREDWRAHVGVDASLGVICGDSESSQLWLIDTEKNTDAGQPLVREITGGLDHSGSPTRCDSVSLRMAVGFEETLLQEPEIEMRYSDDGGNLWSIFKPRGLGRQGEYSTEVSWRKLGHVRAPGRLFQWRMTDDARFRISYARMNEVYR